MRINGFTQIKAFYSWVFDNQDKNVRSTHIALYMFLLNQNNRNSWIEWFKCPFDLAMGGSGISNKKTYYSTLSDLQEWGFIEYKKGINNFKAPLIKIEVLFDTATVPQSEPQELPQSIPLPPPLLLPQLYKNIKLLTDNIELITINVEKAIAFLKQDDLKIEKFSFKKSLLDYGFTENLVDDWLKVRKTKKLTNTETAFEKFIKEVEVAKIDINEVLKTCVEYSWGGFNHEWLENIKKNNLNNGKQPNNYPIKRAATYDRDEAIAKIQQYYSGDKL